MFKVGDYVMGKDRTYKRSLYRVHKIVNNELFDLEFICLGGQHAVLGIEMSLDREQKGFIKVSNKEAHKVQGERFFYEIAWLLHKLEVVDMSQD